MKTNDATTILIDAFRKAVAPPTPFEEIRILCQQVLKDLGDESRPERERMNSAIRLLCCIPAIGDRLPHDALNQIYGRRGVFPVESV